MATPWINYFKYLSYLVSIYVLAIYYITETLYSGLIKISIYCPTKLIYSPLRPDNFILSIPNG